MTATRTKPQQKRLGSCDLKAVSWAKCGENLADTACGTLKRAAFVADPDLPLGSTRENRQTQCNSKLLGKYRFNAYPLVQHSTYDETSVTAACKRYGVRMVTSHWTDSVKIARRAWPEFKGNGGHGLGNLKKVLDLAFQHHDAGEDARAAALVILHAEKLLGKRLTHLSSIQQLSFDFG